MQDSNLLLFFGRFHPLIVHLPIGFLLLAALFEIAEKFSLAKGLKSAVSFTLLLGTLSAIGACTLGFMLSTSGDYNEDMLSYHLWAGIITTLIAGIAYAFSAGFLSLKLIKDNGYYALLGMMVAGLSFTGHMGGNLTHGSDYLTYYMPFKPVKIDPLARPKVESLEQAQLFGDLVHPIIQAKCKSCHNAEKQKGQLSFASIEDYLKGGKHGEVIIPGNAGKSELIHRISLDPADEEFMPPEGKTPLTDEEKAILVFWIENAAADFDTLLSAAEPNAEILAAAAGFLELDGKTGGDKIQFPEISPNQLQSLKTLGFQVRELIAGSHALDVTLPTGKSDSLSIHKYLTALVSLQDNILWLSLENSGLQDKDLQVIGRLKRLRKLKLAKNPVSDQGVLQLAGLNDLESINLYQTNITEASIDALAKLPMLKTIYLWRTNIDIDKLDSIQEKYNHLKLVAGERS